MGNPGSRAEEFQEKFATFIGARHGLGVFNGTVSLETALRAAGVGLVMKSLFRLTPSWQLLLQCFPPGPIRCLPI